MSWSSTDLAYIAGIIDGEGTIGVRRRKNKEGRQYIDSMVSVSNTDERLIMWIQERSPGSIDFREQRSSSQAKPLYRLTWTSRRADVLIPAVLPYLVIKREQADAFLHMRALIGQGQPVTPENHAEREAIVLELQSLNRRGKAV